MTDDAKTLLATITAMREPPYIDVLQRRSGLSPEAAARAAKELRDLRLVSAFSAPLGELLYRNGLYGRERPGE